MSPKSKREYRETVHLRYKNATRSEKTAILDEFCVTCGCHRKHAIRVLKGFKRFTKPKPKKRGKPSLYQNEAILNPLKEIWLAANQPCSKRLKVILSSNNMTFRKPLTRESWNLLISTNPSKHPSPNNLKH